MDGDLTDDLGVVLERAIGDAIDQSVSEHEGGLVTKWLALVESVGPNGERGIWTMTSEGLTQWDSVGLLQHGLHKEQAATIADRLAEEDDD